MGFSVLMVSWQADLVCDDCGYEWQIDDIGKTACFDGIVCPQCSEDSDYNDP